MNSMSMQATGMGAVAVPMMAAMMLPGAVPAIARRARDPGGPLAAPAFAGSYLGIWALVGVAVWLLYRPPGALAAGALTVAAGLYELTPLKQEFRRRCRRHLRSGLHLGVCCLGSSIGLMLVLVAVDAMSVPLMIGVALVVLAQKLFAPRPAVDIPLAVGLIVLGVVIATT